MTPPDNPSELPLVAEDYQATTLSSYARYINEYIHKDGHDDKRAQLYWPGIEFLLSQLKPEATIFEIGSGTGSDARRIERLGFKVVCTDVIDEFLNYLKGQGREAHYYNVLKDRPKPTQSAILANAVFLHFTPEDFRLALRNTREGLREDGLFCLGMKLGTFEGWRDKGLSGSRYFKFWQPQELMAELKTAGFVILNTYIAEDQTFCVITMRKAHLR